MIAAIYDWSGFYIGLNGGGGSSRKCWDINNNAGVTVTRPSAKAATTRPAAWPAARSATAGSPATWVFGVEAQGDWANFKGSNASLFPFVSLPTNQTKVNALGLLTGQVGYALSNVLLYVKGGAAVTADKYNGIATATGLVFDQADETRWGGTVGAGVEVRLRAELVGRRRIRPSVHGQPQHPAHQHRRPACCRAGTTSSRTWISVRSA